MARAPALQAGGQGFDSLALHERPQPRKGQEARTRFFERMRKDTKKQAINIVSRESDRHKDNSLGEITRARILMSPCREIRRRDRRGTRQVPQGARGMPWLPEAMKDAAGCEKPRGGANGR